MDRPVDRSVASLLRQVSFFGSLDEGALLALAERSRRRRFAANTTLFNEGEPGHTLYVIVSGRVNIQTYTPSGDLVHIAQRGPGEPFGEMALIDGKPRMADAVTAAPSDLVMLDRAEFVRCIEASPRIALAVMACLADRLRESAEQRQQNQGLDVLGRLAGLLLSLHAEQEGTTSPNGGPPDIRMTQREMAERVDTTRESINRALAGLKAVGAVRGDGRRLQIVDLEKLRRYVES